jgi:phospholipid-binding lipoprotein MlaA
MKIPNSSVWMMIAAALWIFCGCAAQSKARSAAPSAAAADATDASAQAAPAPAAGKDASKDMTADEKSLLNDDFDQADEPEAQEGYTVADPIEPVNRAMFAFNDKLYSWLLRPLALGYRKVTPRIMRTGVQNFFTNLAAPIRVVNCVLQGKGRSAGVELYKFVVNSTIGGLGFGDWFTDYPDLYPDAEDLGQSLAGYGIGDGFYLVLPFLGPSTARDSIGTVGDGFLDPVNYIDPYKDALAVKGFDSVNHLSFRIEDIDAAKKAAFDPYTAVRNFYIQSRQNRIRK